MNIHEFQGKSLLNQFDIPVQPGKVLDLQSNFFVILLMVTFQIQKLQITLYLK